MSKYQKTYKQINEFENELRTESFKQLEQPTEPNIWKGICLAIIWGWALGILFFTVIL